MTEIRGQLLAGERVELYTDDKATHPYAHGVISHVETTLGEIKVSIGRHAESHEEEEPPEGNVARPAGWK